MPGYLRGKKRNTYAFVAINDVNLLFGWRRKAADAITGLTNADFVACGHKTLVEAQAIASALGVVGCNTPKPMRVTKKIVPDQNTTPGPSVQASASTFCAYNAITTALAAGWNISKPSRSFSVSGSPRSQTVGVKVPTETGDWYYCWSMNKTDAADTRLTDLGIKTTFTDAERKRCFTAASSPRPAKGVLTLPDGSTISSFVASDKEEDAIAAGWSLGGSTPALVNTAEA